MPVLFFGAAVAWYVVTEKKSAIEANLADTARALRIAVDRELVSQLTAVQILATYVGHDCGEDARRFPEKVRQPVRSRSDWYNAALVDAKSGAFMASATPVTGGQVKSSIPPAQLQEIFNAGRPTVVGPVNSGTILKKPVVLVAAPLQSCSQGMYILSVAINPKRFNDLFREQKIPDSWTAAVIDKNLIMAGRTGEADKFVGVRVSPSLAENISRGAEGMFPTTKYDGSIVQTVYNRSPETGWAVAIGIPEREVLQPLHKTLFWLVLSGGTLIVLSLLATGLIGRSIVRSRSEYDQSIKEKQKQLSASVGEYARLVANIPVGVYKNRITADGRTSLEFRSDRFCQLLGISRDGNETVDEVFRSKIVKEDFAEFDRLVKEAHASCSTFLWEGRVVGDGEVKWLHIESTGTNLNNGDQIREGIVYDITTSKHDEAVIRKSEERFRSLAQLGAEWYWEQDENFKFVALPAGINFKNTIPDIDPVGKTRWELGSVDMDPHVWEAHRELLFRHEVFRDFEIRRLGKNGEVCVVSVSGEPIYNEQGQFKGYRGIGIDITARKMAEETIWHQANYDALTSLPNRRMFHDRLSQEIKKAHRSGRQLALLFVDLDNFKEVNDTLGHRTGDLLLIEASRRITQCVRETDTIARMGGDEFTAILTDLENAGDVERVAMNILNQLAASFDLGDEKVVISASIGITIYPADSADIEELLKQADQAMYEAKKQGRNRFSYYTPALLETTKQRIALVGDLREAVSARQLRVYFQPIINLVTGQILKAEALIRWQHPARGMVSPAEFIPLAEETGLILEIGDWVFMESTRWLKRWKTLTESGFAVSINKSPVQFYRDMECERWLNHLRESELSGDCIVIEITEGLLLKSDTPIRESLLAYRENGIQVAIDDFGTGYSSLSYLNKFDIDFLKIDQSFTRNLAPGSSDLALSEAIVVMAHKLGLKVIAEGVETEAQRDLLQSIGCDFAQGYFYSRPLPPEEFESRFLAPQ